MSDKDPKKPVQPPPQPQPQNEPKPSTKHSTLPTEDEGSEEVPTGR